MFEEDLRWLFNENWRAVVKRCLLPELANADVDQAFALMNITGADTPNLLERFRTAVWGRIRNEATTKRHADSRDPYLSLVYEADTIADNLEHRQFIRTAFRRNLEAARDVHRQNGDENRAQAASDLLDRL
uniref:Uncharacterized protein n=1 Tax=Arion vulgaris TaxID=1028688 RepID=A0A0B6Y748_9EUPU